MKSLLLLGLSLAGLSSAAFASEYQVLSKNHLSINLQSTDIVQVMSVIKSSDVRYLTFTLADGSTSKIYIPGGEGDTFATSVFLTGAAKAEVNALLPQYNDNLAITIRVTHAGEELVSQPVVMPPVADGRYTISLETSTDMENWSPSAPGDYLGSSSARFFRVKALRNPDIPAPEAEAKEKPAVGK